jgi:hypothetical protein
MGNEASEKGYGDGYHGKEADNSYRLSDPVSRTVAAGIDIMTGNIGNTLQNADQNADNYDKGYAAGQADRKTESK